MNKHGRIKKPFFRSGLMHLAPNLLWKSVLFVILQLSKKRYENLASSGLCPEHDTDTGTVQDYAGAILGNVMLDNLLPARDTIDHYRPVLNTSHATSPSSVIPPLWGEAAQRD